MRRIKTMKTLKPEKQRKQRNQPSLQQVINRIPEPLPLKIGMYNTPASVAVANNQLPPAQARVNPSQDRTAQIGVTADGLLKLRSQISEMNQRLAETDPQAAEYLDIVLALRNLWADFTGLGNHYISLTRI